MNTPLPALSPTHFPRIVTLPDDSLVRVTRCDASDIAFDRVTALGTTPETYRTTVPAQAVPPLAGFDPLTATGWPADAALAEAIANPPAEVAAVPASVTRRQLFLWLNTQGITRAMLRAQLADNEAALIELEEATEFQRAHPLVAQIGVSLGLDSAEIDAAFITAATL